VARAVPAHASRTYRITRAPTLWIPNDGSATKSIVLNSSGFFPGNAPWKLVDGVIRFECGKFGTYYLRILTVNSLSNPCCSS